MLHRPLISLLTADKKRERKTTPSKAGKVCEGIGGLTLLILVWGAALFAPGYFVAFIIPCGIAATLGTIAVAAAIAALYYVLTVNSSTHTVLKKKSLCSVET